MLNARRTRRREVVVARRIAPKQSRDVGEGAFPEKGIRQDGGDTPKMRTCHCERSEAIFFLPGDCFVAPLLALT